MHYGEQHNKPTGRENTRILHCRACGWRKEERLSEVTLAFRHGHPDTCGSSDIWFVDFEDPQERAKAEALL